MKMFNASLQIVFFFANYCHISLEKKIGKIQRISLTKNLALVTDVKNEIETLKQREINNLI